MLKTRNLTVVDSS